MASGESAGVSIQITDSGIPFNPLEKEDPDVDAPVSERQIGGLGIFLVKKVMDTISYRREGDLNVIYLEKNLSTENSRDPDSA